MSMDNIRADNDLDLLLINPAARDRIYQELGKDLAAVEPPLWCGFIATYVRERNFRVAILDAEAEGLGSADVAKRVEELDPLLAAVIVYGHQPSASTQQMIGASAVCSAIKRVNPARRIVIGGGHVAALPERTIAEEAIDFACTGEGPATLHGLLGLLRAGNLSTDALAGIGDLAWRDGAAIRRSAPAPLIEDLDRDLPGVAWDLLPMERYRAHNWHCFGELESRSPYASIYTTLGCPYRCSFCCINAPFGTNRYRMRSPERVVAEIELLRRRYGVKTLKIADEMFILNDRHVLGIVDRLIERDLGLNIWAYARVDTVKPQFLDKLRRAGFRWLALGIESGSKHVRDGAGKALRRDDIVAVVRAIQSAGINVIGNFIFGLPDDDHETMQETLDLALELNCEFANFYAAMAYPGSALYPLAQQKGWALPERWSGFSQHSYDTLPLPTEKLSARDVLAFRDRAFHAYFEHPRYLQMVAERFGDETREHVTAMTRHRLRRALLEGPPRQPVPAA